MPENKFMPEKWHEFILGEVKEGNFKVKLIFKDYQKWWFFDF